MSAKRFWISGLMLAAFANGCSSDVDDSQATAEASRELSELGQGQALSAGDLEPKVDALTLKLADSSSADLGVAVNKSQIKALAPRGSFQLQLSSKDQAVAFNDLGKEADAKAGDGVFTARLPVSLEKLSALNTELSKFQGRSISQFSPGTHEVIGKVAVPKVPVDIEALRAGKTIRLVDLSVFGPLKTLGGSTSASVNPQKSLVITALPVTEDPARTNNPCASAATNNPLKVWTFGHLMTQMSLGSGLTPSAFVEDWLNKWRANQIVRDSASNILDEVTSAANIDSLVINPWRARSGGGALDLRIAPFRLQAIFYRPDLAKHSYVPSPTNSGGELRFVFGLINARDNNNDGDALDAGDTCSSREMAVIFEYGVPISDCHAQKDWANHWIDLSALLQGTPAYATLLESLTQQIVMAGSNPSKPNGNAINQVRTNEIDVTQVWQFREFHLESSGKLEQAALVNNPREHQFAFTAGPSAPAPINLNGSALLLSEIQSNVSSILAGTYSVPDFSGSQPFKSGGSSYNLGTSWDNPGLTTVDEVNARFKFSFNTCSGCHTRETNTVFYHVRPAGPGAPPTLSSFLTGPLTLNDVRGLSHSFDEMGSRTSALVGLANQACGFTTGIPIPFQLLQRKLISTH